VQNVTRKRPARYSLLMALLLTVALLRSSGASGQFCNQANSVNQGGLVNMGDLTNTISTIRQSVPVLQGNKPYWTFTAIAGVTYTFGSCDVGEDTYLRIYSGTDTSTATEIVYKDDNGPLCSGTSASISWTCTTAGAYSVLLTRYACSNLQVSGHFTYERDGAPCAGTPVAGTISGAGATASCGMAIKLLTLTGYSRDVSDISIQWQSATPTGSFTNISGATLPTYTTPSITTTTRYRAVVTCSNSSLTATTSATTVTVNPNPALTLTPAVTTICGGAPTATLLTAGGANSYVWTAGGTGTGASRTYTPAATTDYEVIGTNTATGCTTTRRATIVVGHTVAPTASQSSICSGGSVQLNAHIAGAPATPGYRMYPIAYAPIATPGSGVTTLAAGKAATVAPSGGNLGDGYWNKIALPFTLQYYGLSSDTIQISTNGHVYMVGGVSPGSYAGTNPIGTYPDGGYDGRAFPLGSDINLTHGGTVEYFTSGTTPNRKFVINYKDVVFDNNEPGVGNVQMIINEGSNIIEFHTGITTNEATPKTQGLISLDGNTAILVPGRNGANVWTSYPDAVSFVPVRLTIAWTPAATLDNAAIASPTASGVSSTTTYSVTVTDAGINCTASGSVGVTVKAAGTWTGAVSSTWTTAGNWCGGVPTASSNVIIPDAAIVPVSPIIGPAASANNITLENGSLLTLLFGPLNLYGNITANGTADFQANNGTLNLAGSGAQTLATPAFTAGTLNISASGVKTLSNDVNITNALNFTNGMLDIGSHTLALDAGATISGSSASSYVRTSAPGGSLRQQVGATPVLFPVGNTTYNPATLTNAGTTDYFFVGVRNQVLTGGTTGTQVDPATTYVVNRTWDVQETTVGGSNVTMTLGWNSGETNSSSFDYSNVYIAHYTGGKYNADPDYPNLLAAPAATGYPGPGPYTATRNDITSFSPFTVGSASPVPLPVTLLELTAKNAGSRNRISWESASGRHTASYVVERSGDGAMFSRMDEVTANGKASGYTAYDNAPADGYTYYRLKMVGADGSFTYSPVVKAFMSARGEVAITVVPNPVHDLLTVHVQDVAAGNVQLTDASGRILIAGAVQQGTATLTTGGLAAGTYFLRFSNGGVHKTIRVTKL
jgi:hypothetical protein